MSPYSVFTRYKKKRSVYQKLDYVKCIAYENGFLDEVDDTIEEVKQNIRDLRKNVKKQKQDKTLKIELKMP